MNRLLHAVRAGPYHASKAHSHSQWELGWYTHGQGRAWIGKQAIALHPGVLVFYPPIIPHFEETTEPLSGIFMIVDAISGNAPQLMLDAGLDSVAGQLCELIRSQSDGPESGVRQVPQLLFEALLLHVQSQQKGCKMHPVIEQMQRLIHERSDDPGFKVSEASKGLPMSRDHARRIFSQEFGCTPVEYLRDIRIQRAQGLLAMGRSVKESSAESGFDDPYYFSRVFRSVTGQSPSAWRERLS